MNTMGLCLKKKMDYEEISPDSTVDTSSEGLAMYSDSSSTTESSENSETFPGFQQIPLAHFGSQQNIWAGETDRLKARQTYKGQLKIAIYVNYGLLTAHVISARHLKSKTGSTCDSYVKVSLVPDEEKRTRCKTDIADDSNNPLYDEKFSFELLDEDIDKRLFVSVWNKNGNKKSCEFLGCMSFGIRSISIHGKPVSGFYYLLPGDIGKRKHLQVAEQMRPGSGYSGGAPLGLSGGGLMEVGNRNSIASIQSTQSFLPPAPQPKLKQQQERFWMDTHVVTVKRSCRGYGFTISGACPVAVCRVEVGSHAHKIALKGGDIILKIDGMNVSRTNADTVARIIRNSVKQVVLEIQRPRQIEPVKVNKLENSPRKTPMLTSTPDKYDSSNNRMEYESYPPHHLQQNVSPWRASSQRHQPYPISGRTPPRSPSLKSVNSSPGRLERNGAVYPSVDTHDYGWIDHTAIAGSGGQNFDSDGFRVPQQRIMGGNNGGGNMQSFGNIRAGPNSMMDAEHYSNTLPRSMKFKTSSRIDLPIQQQQQHQFQQDGHNSSNNSSTDNLHTKDYGWLDSKENLSSISSIHPYNPHTASTASTNRLQTAFSTGTLQAQRKKVSFRDF